MHRIIIHLSKSPFVSYRQISNPFDPRGILLYLNSFNTCNCRACVDTGGGGDPKHPPPPRGRQKTSFSFIFPLNYVKLCLNERFELPSEEINWTRPFLEWNTCLSTSCFFIWFCLNIYSVQKYMNFAIWKYWIYIYLDVWNFLSEKIHCHYIMPLLSPFHLR